jgi:hypothetical protein
MEKVRSIALHVRVSPEVKADLERMAAAERRPLAAMLAILLEKAVEHRPSGEP